MRSEYERSNDRLTLLKYLQMDPLQVEHHIDRLSLLRTRILAIQLWHMTTKKPHLFSYKYKKHENYFSDNDFYADLESLVKTGCLDHLQITEAGEDFLFDFDDWFSPEEETRLAEAIAYVHGFTDGALELYVCNHPIVLATKDGQEVIIYLAPK